MSFGMSNVYKGRPYKERAQPKYREKHFGLLEKHADYVKRAKDYKRKRKILQALQEKARSRNPDEFYFKMVHGRFDADGYYSKRSSGAPQKNLAHLEHNAEDRKLLTLKQTVELKGAERMSDGLHLLAAPPQASTHTIFVLSDDEIEEQARRLIEDDKKEEDNFVESFVKAVGQTRKHRSSSKRLEEAAVAAAESMADAYENVVEKKRSAKQLSGLLEKLETRKHLAERKRQVRMVRGGDGQKKFYVWKPNRKK